MAPPPVMIEPARVVGVRAANPRRRSGRKLGSADGPQPPAGSSSAKTKLMCFYLLITGDFTPLGGMDRANHALASVPGPAGGGGGPPGGAPRLGRPDGALECSSTSRAPAWGKHLLGAPLLARAVAAGAAGSPRAGPGSSSTAATASGVTSTGCITCTPPGGRDGREPAAPGEGVGCAPHCAGRRARCPPRSPPGDRQLGADPVRGDRAAGGRPGARPHGLLRQRPGAVPATDGRRAGRGPHRLGWPDDRPAVAFVGTLGDRRKGFDTLLEAWRRLAGATRLGRPARRRRRRGRIDGWNGGGRPGRLGRAPRLPPTCRRSSGPATRWSARPATRRTA